METDIYVSKAIDLLMIYGPKIALALILLFGGWPVINWLIRMFGNMMQARNLDESLRPYLRNLLRFVLRLILIIVVASMIGIETTSLIALLGAAGLAIGLALQGSLSNFAGGIIILVFRPFNRGDMISAQGYTGTVTAIRIFYTVMNTDDNRVVVIPNGALANSVLVNITGEPTRRLDQVYGISYSDDIDTAKSTLQQIIDAEGRILKSPAPRIFVSELADSSVNLTMHMWCNTPDYKPLEKDIPERVKKSLDKAGISIPFPQRDVHLFNQS
jgi:small conductance mechanosensitive channel